MGIAFAEDELEVLTGGADGIFLVWQIPSLVLKERFASSNNSPLVRKTAHVTWFYRCWLGLGISAIACVDERLTGESRGRSRVCFHRLELFYGDG